MRRRRRAVAGRRTEDQFAYLRDAHQFRNLPLVEQPNASYADTMVRQFLFDRRTAAAARNVRFDSHRRDRGEGGEGGRVSHRAIR
jgi:1,2-phenylacetyl-CoA epoxidase catalytic subunit